MNKQSYFLLSIIGGAIPTSILLGMYFAIPDEFIITFVVFMMLIFFSMLMWWNANAREQEDKWWQDDQCSGWRGY